MAKDLRSFIDDCRRETPNEIIHVTKEVNPANYDVTAIIKHLGADKKFPVIIFDKPKNLNGQVNGFKLVMNCEISQRKIQIALGLPKESTRPEMAEACLEMEEQRVPPTIVNRQRRSGQAKCQNRQGRRSLRTADHAPSRDGRRAVYDAVDGQQRSQERDLQLFLSSHGGQVEKLDGAARFAAPFVENFQNL